jgi:signal peptide peptidase SppA
MPDLGGALMPVIAGILNGTAVEHTDYSIERKANTPQFFVNNSKPATSWNIDDAPEGSVLVLNLKGTILKESQMCGPVGTLELADQITQAKSNQNIAGIVLVTESGGGAVYAVKPLADAISDFKSEKPIIALAEDTMASAAYYIGTYCNEIWANNPKTIIGSIGTMCSFQDFKPYMEKMGVVFHEIYASESSVKNKTFNDALKGNYDGLITKELNPLNADFINSVKQNRLGKISTSENLIYKGETYFATVAKELGMIDSLGNLNDAVARVRYLADNFSETVNKSLNKMKNLTALAGNPTPTAEQLTLANADLTTAGITAVTLVEESFITDAAAVTAANIELRIKLNDAQAELSKAQATVATANQTAATLNAQIATLNEKVTAFGANAGAQHGSQTAENEDQPDAGDNAWQEEIDNMPHNRLADKRI